jgi:hypothetical protein
MTQAAVLCCVATAALIGGSACSKRKNAVQALPMPVALPAPSTAPKAPTPAPTPAPRAPVVNRTPAAPPAPPAPLPEPLTTAEQRSTWSGEIEASLRHAEQNAATLRGRNLPAAQQRDLERVESFIRQARAAEQVHDYSAARSYARRAEILSRDLLKR